MRIKKIADVLLAAIVYPAMFIGCVFTAIAASGTAIRIHLKTGHLPGFDRMMCEVAESMLEVHDPKYKKDRDWPS